MRRGLDFAWSRPGVDAILAGGFTFVLRYLSYDATGKNLTRKEADTYRAHGIDVVSNWEYSTNAALNGFGQGVRDATEGQRQHLACGGDPAAPIYFSVDFDATAAQQVAIDAYLNGCADVIGAGRIGVYGGYWIVKRCLDNGTARWGWQTYAWSGGLWDPRAHVRQVQNGVTVGGADCDINTAQVDNFGQWFAQAAAPGAVFAGIPDREEEDDMKLYLVSAPGDPAVWLSNGINRRGVSNEEEIKGWLAQGAIRYENVDLSWYGPAIEAAHGGPAVLVPHTHAAGETGPAQPDA